MTKLINNPMMNWDGELWMSWCECTKEKRVLMRYLDCDDCKSKGITCDVMICCECGADYDEELK